MEKLKICLISKYPPHKGGTAGINYWFARTLGKLGNEVHLVTDPVEGSENYFQNLNREQMKGYEPKNVRVHGLKSGSPLPAKSRTSMLVNLAIKVIEENEIDLIDTKYFVPYGVSGFFTKLITGKPLVTRHAGSDITYLLKNPSYRTLLIRMLKNSDKIILDPLKLEEIKSLGVEEKRIACCGDFGMSMEPVPREKTKTFLKKIGIDSESPIIGCFGKIFQGKGLMEMLHALSKIKNEDFSLLLVPETDKDSIKSYLSRFELEDRSVLLDYQPPWVMPFLYDSLTALIATEVDFPVKMHTPLTASEAFYLGTCTVISEETHNKPQFKDLEDGVNTIIVDPKDTENYAKKLEWIIKNPQAAEEIGRNVKISNRYPDGKMITRKLVEIYREVIEGV
ncbi:MAG: glycosyltransferase family 4 protein [Candidatus Aenigmatarchaeota archaeon]|nr:MAG: glycosyltransferase family 4 protein [Candidatus Aenigmarchaeota archaeon]